ncbi:hypothetical protein VZT92_003353 [Zoarces viviparus]|uniref:Interleukin-2 receptor subunit beta N-terminal domain-containing protein n=1 Tax=Zoarces viviparus TaxID=48416 RepID=A0AAW1G246_ZOAVI
MERHNKTPLLVLPLLYVCVCVCVCAVGDENCPSVPDNKLTELTCHSDFDQTITCLWNSTSVSDHPGNVCTIFAERKHAEYNNYHNSCRLEPVDASRPTLKKCLLFFKRSYRFQTFHVLSINLSCKHTLQTLSLSFKPACHIKPRPPPRPDINFTTWSPQVTKHKLLTLYRSELQWKHEDQSWTDPSVLKNILTADDNEEGSYTRELDEKELRRGERYEARARVKAIQGKDKSFWSDWSDWSPVASWESAVGGTKERPSDLHVGVLAMVAAAAAFAVFLVVIRFKTDKSTWVYMVKRIRGPPLPNPAKSFLQDVDFQNWSPHFSDESSHSLFKPVEVVSVEVTSAVDAVAPLGLEAALLQKMRSESSYESTSSIFSNPSYSHLCPPPPPPPPLPVSSLTAGSLAPCAADTPYGPVGGHADKAEQEARGEEVKIRLLLSKGGNDSESMPMVSDYEKAEKIQVERARLQSLDSGVCSGEEVSQESLEADSINTAEGEEESEGGSGKEVDFQKLFGGGGGVFHKGSIQVCSGYERVETPQPDRPELLSMDSGVSGVGEEQVSQEDVDQSSESSCLLSPPLPPPCSSSPGFPPLFTPRPLDLCGSGLSPAPPSHFLERIALMSTSRSVEPSGDGYM